MRKVKYFNSFSEYSAMNVFPDDTLLVLNVNNVISMEYITNCKKWQTAIERAFKAASVYEPKRAEFFQWVAESCENGYFKDETCRTFQYHVEDCDNRWYIEITERS